VANFNYVFDSKLSYWDLTNYGGIVSIVEAGLDVIVVTLLLRRLTSRWEKVLSTALAGRVVVPMIAMASYHALYGRGVIVAVEAETSISGHLENQCLVNFPTKICQKTDVTVCHSERTFR
jgi:hypothetical protein